MRFSRLGERPVLNLPALDNALHVMAGFGQVAIGPTAIFAVSAGLEDRSAFLFITDRPVSMADVVVVEELHPSVGFGSVHCTVSAGANGAPLGGKQRDAIAQRRASAAALLLLVGRGVEVQGVGDVHAIDGIFRRLVNKL